MARAARDARDARRRRLLKDPASPVGSDIFAGQATEPGVLAELYDLEHDPHVEDLVFYAELARRARGDVLDLGCGSGRLFGHLLPRAPRRLLGVDGSEALLERGRLRIAADPRLRAAVAAGRLDLRVGDVRTPPIGAARFSLVVLAGVLPHLSGADDAQRVLLAARRCLTRRGRIVVDVPGPGGLPERDLPLAVDWRRRWRGRTVVRRSQLWRQQEPDALRVMLSTLVEMREADGTITRLPAAYRLWYPEAAVLERLVAGAGLRVAALFGSHDLEPFGATSERLIVIAERG